METITQEGTLPLVSIVITSYNCDTMINEAIESALNQDYANLEIIISDNCSTDNSDAVIRKYVSDSRIKYSRNETNIGMLPNFKKAIEVLSTGRYFVNLCSDDVLYYRSFIKDGIALFNKYKDVVLVHGKSHCVNVQSGKISSDKNGPLYEQEFRIGREVFINYSGTEIFGWDGVIIDRQKFNSLDIFKEETYTGFDLSSNLKLMLLGNAGFINKHCYLFRMHETNGSKELKALHSLDNFKVIEDPYNFAMQNNYLGKDILGKWKNNFVRNRAGDVARRLYMVDKSEFRIFLNEIETRYDLKFIDLNKGIRSRIFYMLYYFPFLGNFALRIRKRFLRRLE